MRSHTGGNIQDAAIDQACKFIATSSNGDSTVRVWDFENCKQLYDFQAPNNECPTRLAFQFECHEKILIDQKKIDVFLACGFDSGKIRIFNVNVAKKLLREMPSAHSGSTNTNFRITDLKYANEGRRLIVADALKYICLYNVERDYSLLRMLPNCVLVPGSLCVNWDMKSFAVIGMCFFSFIRVKK